MAKRLKTRLSAGAALATGIGMMGIATAVPAQASTSLQYECSMPDLSETFDFTLDTGVPDTATVGDELTITPSGTLTLNPETVSGLTDAGVEYLDGNLPAVEATISNGTESVVAPTDISIPRTQINDETPDLPLNGTAQTAEVSQAGEYTISAPDTFTMNWIGYDANEVQVETYKLACAYVEGSGSQVIDTVTVSDEDPAPVADDWFAEPDSLPISEDQKSFTVEGEAAQDGVISVQLLDSDKKALRTDEWNVTEGTNSKNFPFAEGTDYVRIISQDCVDADGDDETVLGSGCNVEYYAPWVNPDNGGDTGDGGDLGQDAGNGDDQGQDAGGDDSGSAPEVPEVVQTDGFQRTAAPQQDTTLAFAFGGLLLAGAGAGTVLVARRRAAIQR